MFQDKILTSNEIHVWRLDIRDYITMIDRYKIYLSVEEQQHENNYTFPHLSQHYVMRRALLRRILSLYLAIEPQDIILTTYLKGKPCLNNIEKPLYFNLSYSKDLVYYVIASQANIGIDIEYIQEKYISDEAAELIFHPDEYMWFKTLSPHVKINVFYQGWIQKEAIVKAMGEGLYYPLEKINLKDSPWNLLQLETPQKYLGCLATEHKVDRIHYYDLLKVDLNTQANI